MSQSRLQKNFSNSNRNKQKVHLNTKKDGTIKEIEYKGRLFRSNPIFHSIGQNLDFSGFKELLSTTYEIYRTEHSRRYDSDSDSSGGFEYGRGFMPFAIYQHALVEILTAHLITISKGENVFYNTINGHYYIPKVIHDYICGIETVETPSGNIVRFNYPKAAFPQPPIIDQNVNVSSGTFGRPSEANHNAYECYFSPYITKSLIERTIEVNKQENLNQNGDFGDWNPFPEAWTISEFKCNRNLLGYQKPERLNFNSLRNLEDCRFYYNDDSELGRLCHCDDALRKMSQTVFYSKKLEYVESRFEPYKSNNSSALIMKQFSKESYDARLYSPFLFNANEEKKATYYSYKQIRNAEVHGCFLTNETHEPPPGWIETMNNNLNMIGDFEPNNLVDRPSLRDANFKSRVLHYHLYNEFQNLPKSFERNTAEIVYENKDYKTPFSYPVSHNFDFGGLTELLSMSYKKNERYVPFAIYQHVIIEFLNVYLHSLSEDCNNLAFENVFINFNLPRIIYDYITNIGISKTLAGDIVYVNYPIAAKPQPPIIEESSKVSAGTFGRPTESNHNAYECYFAPYITKKLIERTIEVNKQENLNQNGDFGDWNPFPETWTIPEFKCNRNLLGYQKPERLIEDGLEMLEQCTFSENSYMSNFCHSPEAIFFVSRAFSNTKYSILLKSFPKPRSYNNAAAFIIKEYDTKNYDFEKCLSSKEANLYSPFKFDSSAANKAHYYGYKRSRTISAHGSFLTNSHGQPPPGWIETRNENFEMIGLFAPKSWKDRSSMREKNHGVDDFEDGDIATNLNDWFWIEFKQTL